MRVQKKVPNKKRRLRKPIIFILILIPIILIGRICLSYAKKTTVEPKIKYYTGEIYKANHSANLIDYIKDENNIVISPYNINSSINGLYNLSENNEIKKYFNMTLEESNNLYNINKESLSIIKIEETEYEKLYISYVNELTKYNNYTINDITKLSENDKQHLILLLTKTKLCINTINKTSDNSVNFIKQYSLSKEEIDINDHKIYNMLIEYLDDYETYNYKENINNYNELIYNKDLLTKPKKKKKKVELPKINNVTLTGISYKDKTQTVNELNNKIRSNTNNNVRYIINETNIDTNNLLYINSFNFQSIWQNNFKKEYITPGEFTTYNKKIEIVDFLYETTTTYYENNNAKAFKKDFQNNKYSFIGILPNSKSNIKLSNLGIEDLLNNKKEEETTIAIPKFDFQYELNLVEYYKQIGIEETLKSEYELKNLTSPLTLNHMVSKVSITIDEKGTHNSTITNPELNSKQFPETVNNIILNRPFAFLIIDNETQNVLLIGKVNNPNEA